MVVIEQGEKSFGAYVPDLPACVAVAETEAEVKKLIQEAIDTLKIWRKQARKLRRLCQKVNMLEF